MWKRGETNDTVLADLPLAFSTSVLRPLAKLLPLIIHLIDEIELRHRALAGGDETTRQLSFCMRGFAQRCDNSAPIVHNELI